MTSPFSEAELVERPAMDLLASLGWAAMDATDEIFGEGGTLGRSTAAEVVLRPRLRAALARLNPHLAPEGLTQAEEALTRDRGSMGLLAANRDRGVAGQRPRPRSSSTSRNARPSRWA